VRREVRRYEERAIGFLFSEIGSLRQVGV
jgi:hypothetical protein